MRREHRCVNVRFAVAAVLTAVGLWFAITPDVVGEQLFQLRNGLVLRGRAVAIPTLNQNAFSEGAAGQARSLPVLMIDDGLRRTYLHRTGMLAQEPVEIADLGQPITFEQPVSISSKEVQVVGQILGVTPFSEYGRRTVRLRGPEGKPVRIVQGITELNDRFAKVEALKVRPYYNWDMRLATRGFDSATLNRIFRHRLDQSDLDQRLQVVRFYIETERYFDAHQALREVIRDFPEEKRLEQQLIALTERQAAQLLEEAELRAEAGQYMLARQILENFPTRQVDRVTRLKVEDAVGRLESARERAATVSETLREQVGQLDEASREELAGIVQEIVTGLTPDTLPRLSDFNRLANADNVSVGSRVALAVSGWLLGSGSGEQNLKVAISLVKVRELVSEYLASDDPERRRAILKALEELEGAEPEYVARMLPLLLPPLPLPDGSADEQIPGFHRIGLDGEPDRAGLAEPRYAIQLPPEYDPLRSYPCIVALHPLRATPEAQIDWWAGGYDEAQRTRMGQASRHGFIVVAPRWSRGEQSRYEYTPREHERVLAAVRDAMRRAQIDSDRVFIVGHGEGATAAWDIGVSHPDIWAGLISISAEPAKTIAHYNANAEYLPVYLVMGESDRAPPPLTRIGGILDDYLNFDSDAMVVMYRGRGLEYFPEETHRFFEWMKLASHTRRDVPREIEAATMRDGDRFFWWLELGQLKPLVSLNPILWDQAERIRAGKVSGSVLADNQIRIGSVPADSVTVWLRPGMGIDLTQRVTIRRGSRPTYFDFDRDLEVMLEDARRRADRKRPYWAKIEL